MLCVMFIVKGIILKFAHFIDNIFFQVGIRKLYICWRNISYTHRQHLSFNKVCKMASICGDFVDKSCQTDGYVKTPDSWFVNGRDMMDLYMEQDEKLEQKCELIQKKNESSRDAQQLQQQPNKDISIPVDTQELSETTETDTKPHTDGGIESQDVERADQIVLLNHTEKRKAEDDAHYQDVKKAKIETKALKAKRPGFTDERYNETSYYIENSLRKVYPYYFTFTTFTKGRWVGEKILDVFAREFRAHPVEEYERCIKAGTLTVNYEKVDTDYRLKHNDLLANIVHRHEVPVTADPIKIINMDPDVVVVDKPASIPVHPCGRYRHNTVVFILAKEYNLKNLRTIHRLDRLTSGILMFGRNPKKARDMEQQIRTRQVEKEYVCRVEGEFPEGPVQCSEPIEVVSYKIGVCKVSPRGKDCRTEFLRLSYNGQSSVVSCKPHTGRMHQIRVHLQYLGFPIVNDPLYNHTVFGPQKGKGGVIGKTDEQLIHDLIAIHNAENWLGMDGDEELSMFKNNKKKDVQQEVLSNTNLSGNNENVHSRSLAETSLKLPEPTIRASATIKVDVAAEPHNHINTSLLVPSFGSKVTVGTQTGQESLLEYTFHPEKMTQDEHCYECKVKYRDPKPKDLVMFLHAWRYKGPDWEFQTSLPEWADPGWKED